ncbi:MAG: hypothetical protein Harvfovirus61_1, partial [Harvfovirus sp.]
KISHEYNTLCIHKRDHIQFDSSATLFQSYRFEYLTYLINQFFECLPVWNFLSYTNIYK